MDPLLAVMTMTAALMQPLMYIISDRLALDFLFGGKVEAVHKTKFAVEKLVERYADSIVTLNRAIILSVAFVPIALLPSGDAVTLPLIDLAVTRQNWLRACPAISYGLQIFSLVALCSFLLLRRGLRVLKEEVGAVEHFGEVRNLMLTGVLGSLWMVISIRTHFPSRWHLVWFIPVGSLLISIMFSPSVLCAYFVTQLFILGDLVPAIMYSMLLLPSVALAFVLIGVSALGSMGEVLSFGRG